MKRIIINHADDVHNTLAMALVVRAMINPHFEEAGHRVIEFDGYDVIRKSRKYTKADTYYVTKEPK